MTGVPKDSVNYASRIRAMSREYFMIALNRLPAEQKATVEHDLKQMMRLLNSSSASCNVTAAQKSEQQSQEAKES